MHRSSAALLVALACVLTVSVGSAAADDFGARVAGQHVYDRSGVLTSDQVQVLEDRVATLEGAHIPAVIYIQVKSATLQQAQQDARNLMDAWNVQSAEGARDGFVMFFDLTPGDTRHGQVGLFAGGTYARGPLSSTELDRIAGDVMRPALARGDLAGGAAAGLDAVAADVGEPTPSPFTTEAAPGEDGRIVRDLIVVFVSLIVALVAITIFHTLRIFRRARGGSSSSSASASAFSSFSSGGDGGSASSGGSSGGTSF